MCDHSPSAPRHQAAHPAMLAIVVLVVLVLAFELVGRMFGLG